MSQLVQLVLHFPISSIMRNYYQPCLKPVVEYLSANGKISFFHRPGFSIQLDDASGFIAALCKSMDGRKNLDELIFGLTETFPKEVLFIEKLLAVLDGEYLIEDNAKNLPGSLSEYELVRWSRNIEFFGAYCKASENKYSYQEKLKSAKVVVLGLGGVGSNILYNLVALGITQIKAVDFDQVELSNLNRQIIYDEADVGQLKSDAAKKRLKAFAPHADIQFINKKIISCEDIQVLINGYDIVIGAVDHPRENIIDWLNIACVSQNIPFICGSLDSKLVAYFSIVPGVSGCIQCWKSSKRSEGLIFQDIIQHENFVTASSPNTAIMPFISIVAGMVSNELLKIITGIFEPLSLGKFSTIDFVTSNATVSESWDRIPHCEVCSVR